MTYSSEFKKIYNKIEYKTIDKMYYRTKAFKIGVKYWSSKIVDAVFDKPKNGNIFLYKPRPIFKQMFKTENEIVMFARFLNWGNYVKTENEVIDFLNKLAYINKVLGPEMNHIIVVINGPKDINHLNELKNLKYDKKTEIESITLKEILKKPTHAGYKYKLQGIYNFEKTPKNIKELRDEIFTFIEIFGGKENDNIIFTGTIKNILDGDPNLEQLWAIKSILRGFTSLTFTLHYKDHGELLSLNFMKNNVSITTAVEFMNE